MIIQGNYSMLHSSHACQCTVFRNKVISIMRMDKEAHEKERDKI